MQNLEEGAVWKHENLKPKNVNPIDIEYLGFPSTSNGLVQFRTYTFEEEHYIFQKIRAARLSAADYKIVMDRFETRLGEVKYLKTIEGFAKSGEINVGFNYADNGIQQATTRQIRKFALESQEVAGGTLYTPYQENLSLYSLRKGGTLPSWCERGLGSVLCRVTGDMDGVYITTTAGGAVDQSKLVRILRGSPGRRVATPGNPDLDQRCRRVLVRGQGQDPGRTGAGRGTDDPVRSQLQAVRHLPGPSQVEADQLHQLLPGHRGRLHRPGALTEQIAPLWVTPKIAVPGAISLTAASWPSSRWPAAPLGRDALLQGASRVYQGTIKGARLGPRLGNGRARAGTERQTNWPSLEMSAVACDPQGTT